MQNNDVSRINMIGNQVQNYPTHMQLQEQIILNNNLAQPHSKAFIEENYEVIRENNFDNSHNKPLLSDKNQEQSQILLNTIGNEIYVNQKNIKEEDIKKYSLEKNHRNRKKRSSSPYSTGKRSRSRSQTKKKSNQDSNKHSYKSSYHNTEKNSYPKPPSFNEENGDWLCSECGNWNFSKRIKCNRCSKEKQQKKKITINIHQRNDIISHESNISYGNYYQQTNSNHYHRHNSQPSHASLKNYHNIHDHSFNYQSEQNDDLNSNKNIRFYKSLHNNKRGVRRSRECSYDNYSCCEMNRVNSQKSSSSDVIPCGYLLNNYSDSNINKSIDYSSKQEGDYQKYHYHQSSTNNYNSQNNLRRSDYQNSLNNSDNQNNCQNSDCCYHDDGYQNNDYINNHNNSQHNKSGYNNYQKGNSYHNNGNCNNYNFHKRYDKQDDFMNDCDHQKSYQQIIEKKYEYNLSHYHHQINYNHESGQIHKKNYNNSKKFRSMSQEGYQKNDENSHYKSNQQQYNTNDHLHQNNNDNSHNHHSIHSKNDNSKHQPKYIQTSHHDNHQNLHHNQNQYGYQKNNQLSTNYHEYKNNSNNLHNFHLHKNKKNGYNSDYQNLNDFPEFPHTNQTSSKNHPNCDHERNYESSSNYCSNRNSVSNLEVRNIKSQNYKKSQIYCNNNSNQQQIYHNTQTSHQFDYKTNTNLQNSTKQYQSGSDNSNTNSNFSQQNSHLQNTQPSQNLNDNLIYSQEQSNKQILDQQNYQQSINLISSRGNSQHPTLPQVQKVQQFSGNLEQDLYNKHEECTKQCDYHPKYHNQTNYQLNDNQIQNLQGKYQDFTEYSSKELERQTGELSHQPIIYEHHKTYQNSNQHHDHLTTKSDQFHKSSTLNKNLYEKNSYPNSNQKHQRDNNHNLQKKSNQKKSFQKKEGDWECYNCKNINYARRDQCNRCKEKKR